MESLLVDFMSDHPFGKYILTAAKKSTGTSAAKKSTSTSAAKKSTSTSAAKSRAGKTLELTVTELNEQFSLALDPVRVAIDQRAYYDALAVAVEPLEDVVAFARARAKDGFPLSVARASTV